MEITLLSASLPKNESARLETLRRYHILDTPPEQAFDDITKMASMLCDTPISLVTLIDQERQWFKSSIGLNLTETSRDLAFCAHAILGSEIFIVPDALGDERFAENPLVTTAPHLRFYAGVPLVTLSGHAMGTLCVIDHRPRKLTSIQKEMLQTLARQVVAQLELRRYQLEEAQTLHIGSMSFDVTAETEAKQALKLSESRFRAAAEASMDAFFLLDSVRNAQGEIEDFLFVDMNSRAEELLDLPRAKVIGERLCILLPVNRTDGFFEKYVRVMETKEALEEEFAIDAEHIMASWLHHQVVAVGDGVAITSRDVTVRIAMEAQIDKSILEMSESRLQLMLQAQELAEANAKLEQLAMTDGLTGLINYRTFHERIDKEFARSVRHSKPLSVLLLDVDKFKDFNDNFGHPAGDHALKLVASLIQDTARSTDLAARYGGEEFMVLLPETDREGACLIAERIRKAVAEYAWSERLITISIGISFLRPTSVSPDDLISEADKALYLSKANGRNCVSSFDIL